jgi:hypothetical protein
MIGYPIKNNYQQPTSRRDMNPLAQINEQTTAAMSQLEQMQKLRSTPQMQEAQQQDSLLRSLGDLLPPEVIQTILASRFPEMDPAVFQQGVANNMGQASAGQPAGVSPEMMAAVQQMLKQQ